jgi:hypothetical protein
MLHIRYNDISSELVSELVSPFEDSSALRLKIPDAGKFPTKNFLKNNLEPW